MSSVNKVILIGNLGQKPELKYIQGNRAVCQMSIATNEKWTDKQGQKHEKAEWHRVVVWGKLAENCAQYLDKGRSVYVEGRLQTRSWDDKNSGEKKYMTEIVAQQVTFLGGGKSDGGSKTAPKGDKSNDGDDFGPPPGDDDIPF